MTESQIPSALPVGTLQVGGMDGKVNPLLTLGPSDAYVCSQARIPERGPL